MDYIDQKALSVLSNKTLGYEITAKTMPNYETCIKVKITIKVSLALALRFPPCNAVSTAARVIQSS